MMSNDKNILAGTQLAIGDAALSVKKLCGAFDGMWAPGDLPRGTKARVEGLAEDLEQLSGLLEDACSYIDGDWLNIENNLARLNAVKEFLKTYKAFRDEVLRLDDLCIGNVSRDDEVFGASSVVVDLMLLLSQYDTRLAFVDEYLTKAQAPKEDKPAKYQGLCDKLYTFISGVSPQVMEAFLDNNEAPLLKGNWIGSKRDATYFGHHFRKECVQMNMMFNFTNDDGRSAKLNYFPPFSRHHSQR